MLADVPRSRSKRGAEFHDPRVTEAYPDARAAISWPAGPDRQVAEKPKGPARSLAEDPREGRRPGIYCNTCWLGPTCNVIPYMDLAVG